MTIDLDAIRARAWFATPGPWEVVRLCPDCGIEQNSKCHCAGKGDFGVWRADNGPNWNLVASPMIDDHGKSEQEALDADFIAHARQDIPALLTEVQRLRKELVDMEVELERLRNGSADPNSVRFDSVIPEPWEGNGPCCDCGGRSPSWMAPNELWDAVMGSEAFERLGVFPTGVICPVCFAQRAWTRGVADDGHAWVVALEPIRMVPASDVIRAYDERNAALAGITELREETAELEASLAAANAVIEQVKWLALDMRMALASGHTSAYDLRADLSSVLDELNAALLLTTEAKGEGNG